MNSRTKNLIGLAIAAALVLMAAQWWMQAPNKAIERFIGHATAGRYVEADALLDGPSSIELATDGSLRIVDARGGSATIDPVGLPLMAGAAIAKDLPPRSSMDRLYGRDRAALSAVGDSSIAPLTSPPKVIHLAVERGRLTIESVD